MRRGSWATPTALVLALAAMALPTLLLAEVVRDAVPVLSWSFLTTAERQLRAGGGVGPELFNTLYVVGLALALSLPPGVAIAVLRREYLGSRRRGASLEALAEFAAGVPSVVVGFAVFLVLVGDLGWPFSRGAGVVALFLVNLPWVAASAMALLAGVPDALREASLALGATRWETVRRVVLPSVAPGLVSTVAIGAARLLGESAALLFTTGVNAAAPGYSWWAQGATLAVHLFTVRTEGLMPDAVAVSAATGVILLALVVVVLVAGRVASGWFRARSGIV